MKTFTVTAFAWLVACVIHGAGDQEIAVKLGGKATVGGLQIVFHDVVSDSRCPEGARCVWAGNAQVALQLEKEGEKPVVAKLNTGAPPKEIVHGGYVVRLKSLEPRPKLKTTITKTDYVATLVISERNEVNAPAAPAPNRVPATVPVPVQQDYPVDVGVHWVGVVMERGAKLKLEDGSVWEVARKDHTQVMYWRVSDKISVSRGPDDQYPFKLTNTGQNATADARLVSRPK